VGGDLAVSVTTLCYCSREDAQRAIDFHDGVVTTANVDRAIQSAARNIEGHLHRLFYPWDGTKFFDWPNFLYQFPWKLGLGRNDLIVLTALNTGTVSIGLDQVFMCPPDRLPGYPYRWLELDRSTAAAFGGAAATPQRSIQVTGTWGFTADADQAATLAASAGTSDTSITVDDSSQTGVGDLLIIGYGTGSAPYPDDTLHHAGYYPPYAGERVLVTDKAAAATGLTQSAGCTTAEASDNALTTTGTGTLYSGEVLLLDQEQLLITDVTGSVATVVRAWNGTILAAHSDATVYAYRSLSVARGQLGTTAAAWDSGEAVYKQRYPSLIRDLAIAEAENRALQETSGYARTVGAADMAVPAPGVALADLWAEAMTAYGRKARIGAI
jgi:hypothetical protein